MPDVRDLLHDAAGEPVAPLDLDAVLRSGARRTARRRTLLASAAALPVVVAAVVLLGPPGSGGTDRLVPAAPPTAPAPAPSAPAPSTPTPAPAGTPAPAPAPDRVPGPSRGTAGTGTPGAPAAPAGSAVADGSVYVLLTGVDSSGYGFTYDKVDYLGDACLAAVPKPTATGEIAARCYRNVNPLLRRATASASTRVVVADSSGEPLPSDWAGLRAAAGLPGPPLAARPWLVTFRGGVVTSIVGQVYEAS